MKASELLESKAIPEIINQEAIWFKGALKRCGFQCRKRPRIYRETKQVNDTWIVGGSLFDLLETDEAALDSKMRIRGLQKIVAKHLFELKEKGLNVSMVSIIEHNAHGWPSVSSDEHFLYKGDSLAQIEKMVIDKVYLRTKKYHDDPVSSCVYGIEVAPEQPAPTERKPVRVVKAVKRAA
jgi:hypothetical protein